MQNLKKMIIRYMRKIILLMVVVILLISVGVQMLNEQRRARDGAAVIFKQIEQILEENNKEIIEIEEEYRQTCFNNAEIVAYIIRYHPDVLDSVDELKKIAEYVEVDEIHIFNEQGEIIMGTNPEYFGLTMNSGEQISFFKPMLTDKSLKLCQDITPNTAESKLMQYSALWSENEEFIVQVGMEPVSVMRVTDKNKLSYIFSMLRVNLGVQFLAIDVESGEIVGSTNEDDLGKNLIDIGLSFEKIENKEEGFHAKVNGVASYCIFKEADGNYIGRVVANEVLYQRIPNTFLGLLLCLVLIAIILVFSVSAYMNRYVIDGIYNVNGKLRAITEGNLDETVEVNNSIEFSELSNHINDMIKSLLSTTEKMSYILNKVDMHIGVYEYNGHMKNVRFTEFIPELLSLNEDSIKHLSYDYNVFKKHMDELRANPLKGEEGVYCIKGEKDRYVKIEEITKNNDILGIVIDVTDEILKRRQIEEERDIDILTGVYNRRGMERKLLKMLKEPEKLLYSALVMIDADGLKDINDKYGHEKGDIYLRGVVDILKAFDKNKSMVSRFGGDEFVLFLHNYETEEELLKDIEILKNTQDKNYIYFDSDLSVSIKYSLGYCMVKEKCNYESLLKQADKEMYINKSWRKSRLN